MPSWKQVLSRLAMQRLRFSWRVVGFERLLCESFQDGMIALHFTEEKVIPELEGKASYFC